MRSHRSSKFIYEVINPRSIPDSLPGVGSELGTSGVVRGGWGGAQNRSDPEGFIFVLRLGVVVVVLLRIPYPIAEERRKKKEETEEGGGGGSGPRPPLPVSWLLWFLSNKIK
jgi:hypothetical protein